MRKKVFNMNSKLVVQTVISVIVLGALIFVYHNRYFLLENFSTKDNDDLTSNKNRKIVLLGDLRFVNQKGPPINTLIKSKLPKNWELVDTLGKEYLNIIDFIDLLKYIPEDITDIVLAVGTHDINLILHNTIVPPSMVEPMKRIEQIYIHLVKLIRSRYPKSQLHLVTLAKGNYYGLEKAREQLFSPLLINQFNQLIVKIASKNRSISVVDISDLQGQNYFYRYIYLNQFGKNIFAQRLIHHLQRRDKSSK